MPASARLRPGVAIAVDGTSAIVAETTPGGQSVGVLEAAVMSAFWFYWRWLRLAMLPAYSRAGKVSWGILVGIAALSYFLPLPDWIIVTSWLIPAGAFSVLATIGLARAPYLLYTEKEAEGSRLKEQLDRRAARIELSKLLTEIISRFDELSNREIDHDIEKERQLLSSLDALESYTFQRLEKLLPEYAEEFKTVRMQHPNRPGERKFEHAKRLIIEQIAKLRAFQRRFSGGA